ncbi:MAG TPA: protein kinase, partial [Kofleriaceae bacterium]
MDPQHGPPQPDLLIGQTIGNYLVTQKLGEGGMGAVYLAEHPSIGKKVALKVLHSEFSTNQEVTARFFHEAKAVNDIGHPNIVDIVDFGIIQAGPGREQLVYFIMEYLAGVTLSQLIRSEAPLPPERALSVALQVADALSASHKCGIVHRDLKPDNIILLQRGRERDFVKLLDFGIAKLTGGSAVGSHRTRTGIVMGTPAYMSPEQCEGRDTVDHRTDIYALGIVLYEMLTGRVPFVGEGYGEILVQHLTQRPAPLSQYRMLQAHVEVVVLKALEKRADLRYPTMEEFMRAMSDPVGYVEANGGVSGFLQRQLMPSNAPLPPVSSIRLTPASLTPLPGTIVAPSIPGVAPGMPSSHGIVATPAPTTLGSATGQVQGSRGKAGYILAALVIVAAAAAIIVVLAGKDRVQVAGNGSEVASGSAGSGATGTAGMGSSMGTPGSAAPGSGSEVIAASGSGSSTAGTGPGSSNTAGTGPG